jgi:hypothetical protein
MHTQKYILLLSTAQSQHTHLQYGYQFQLREAIIRSMTGNYETQTPYIWQEEKLTIFLQLHI